MEEQLLIISIVLMLIFIALRYSHYIQQRKQGHDKYMIVSNGENYKCPDLDMFGFKFSVILGLSVFNILLVIYLCFKLLRK